MHSRVGKIGEVETGSSRTAGLLLKNWEEKEREERGKKEGRERGRRGGREGGEREGGRKQTRDRLVLDG